MRYFCCVVVVSCCFVQNLLDESAEEGEITSEVLELSYFVCYCCIGDC